MLGSTWIVIGGSPSAPAMLEVAKADYPDALTITTNDGLLLIVPDYFFLSDMIACEEFHAKAAEYQKTHGMKLITLAKRENVLQSRGVANADYKLEFTRPQQPQHFHREAITDCMFSGLYCAQFAIHHGAKRLAVVGHEGYPPDGTTPYWRRGVGPAQERHSRYTKQYIGPWWTAAVEQCRDIEFHFYGDLWYEIDGPNVTKTRATHENTDAA